MDCFVSHAWRQGKEWIDFEKFLYEDEKIMWRNFSMPWHDPALKLSSGVGKSILFNNLTSQIKTVNIFFLLEAHLEKASDRLWIDFELKVADENQIPIIMIPTEKFLDYKLNTKFYAIDYTYDSLHKCIKKNIS